MGFEKTARDAIWATKCRRVVGFSKAVAFIAARWVLLSTRSWRTTRAMSRRWIIAWRSSPKKVYVAWRVAEMR